MKRLPSAKKQYWVAYCRRSTDDPKKQVHSLADQDKKAREHYAALPQEEKEGRPLLMLEHELRSAFHPDNREVFKELLAMAERGEVHGVIAAQFNRISRNPADTGAFIQHLVSGTIHCFDSAVDKRRYTGKDSNAIVMLGMEGGMGWKDSSDKGVLILERMERRAAEGKHMGRKPFGFKRKMVERPDGSQERTTVPDEDRLRRIVEMYHLASTGAYSLDMLEKWAEEEGIRARPTKNNEKGKLAKTAIAHMLHDPYYKGEVWFNKKFQKRWTEEPPVSVKLWENTQVALAYRCTRSAKPKNLTLRQLFILGSMMRCGECGGALSPYRVCKKQKQYIYYECKSEANCKVCIPQKDLYDQLLAIFDSINLGDDELDKIREHLLKLHTEKSKGETERRKTINADYEVVKTEIGKLFSQRTRAVEMGMAEEVDAQLATLRERRDALQLQLNREHDEGNTWIEKVIKCFELLTVAQDVLNYGSPQAREAILIAFASNYVVKDGTLRWEPRSPFREAFQREGHPLWWAILGSNQ